MKFSELSNMITNLKNSTPYEYSSNQEYMPYEGLLDEDMQKIFFEVLRAFQSVAEQKGEYIYKEDLFGIMNKFFQTYAEDGEEAYKRMLNIVVNTYLTGDSWENYKKTPTELFVKL